MRRFWRLLLCAFTMVVLIFTYLPGNSPGEKGDEINLKKVSTKPIEITAEELIAERQQNRVIFKRNVEARQEGLIIYADSLTAWYGKEGKEISKIEADGNVRVVQEGVREAQGDKAVFLTKRQTIDLIGNTVVSEGDSRLQGDSLTIFLLENKSIIRGGEKGRVKAIINPERFIERGKGAESK